MVAIKQAIFLKFIFIKHWYMSFILFLSVLLNSLGISMELVSRKLSRYHLGKSAECTNKRIEDYQAFHDGIQKQIKLQKKETDGFMYYKGLPYQSLDILDIYGARPTELRFQDYNLQNLITSSDHILDIGANCGFMAIYSVFRTGCNADAIDHNPYMVQIGKDTAKYLEISDKVNMITGRFQDYKLEAKYSIVFSFAAHWTDDKGYRVGITDHLEYIHSLLTPGGTLVFESHTTDVNNKNFYDSLKSMRTKFEWDGSTMHDNGTRELFIMKKV